MNPYKPSACPLCRAPYAHLPKVCIALHTFLARAFPDEYNTRQREADERSVESGISSPQVHVGGVPAGGVPLSSDEARCASTAHLKAPHMALAPVVLRCGHMVCNGCLLAEQVVSLTTNPNSSHPIVVCPACGDKGVAGPRSSPCVMLGELLEALHPQGQADSRSLHAEHPVDTSGLSEGQAPGVDTTNAAAVGGLGRGQVPRSVLPHLDEALRSDTLEPADKWALVRREVATHADNMFAWYFVGCDQCGAYPIVGRRYQCLDCPESIGYDECGACHDAATTSGATNHVGRFNQAHTSAHRMRRVVPDLDVTTIAAVVDNDVGKMQGCLNCLAVLHPELDAEQIVASVARQLMAAFTRE
eukprot:CAMPEP_0202871820 /NCGR_PEP_ID=MMETSP1391-20130828/19762_1 /ASSEMBLY_ACC=CAM_ASM_000867 /TAXON_ID=1034604 /ORGANISM="Chlamydomonas leiostraca, Strain SAG 11-49" /LENGTH=358 /DNA_ID=CAMNT_0049552715 /DNA_START=315 /DNA_END=1391 /DNA_ORIENTATION=-